MSKVVGLLVITAALIAGCSNDSRRSSGSSEQSTAACSDSLDNDGDGQTDCDDPGCGSHSFCAMVGDGGHSSPDGGTSSAADGGRTVGSDGGSGVPDASAAGDSGVSEATVEVSWEFPALIPYEGDQLFPTYVAHLFGLKVDHPIEMQTACAAISKSGGSTETVKLRVSFPGYATTTSQDVVMDPGETDRVCLNPVFDLEALYALRSQTTGRIEVSAEDEKERDVGSYMQAVVILPGNEIVWLHPHLSMEQMLDLSPVYVTPHHPQVESLLTDVQKRSVFPRGFGTGGYERGLRARSHRLGVGEHVVEDIVLEDGETMEWAIGTVGGGSDDDVNVYLFTLSQYEAWLEGTGNTATRVWSDQVSGSSGSTGPVSPGWYGLVLHNTNDNFVSRDVEWTRSNTREDVVRDALRAIYNEMAARATTYVNIPGTYYETAQHIKRPDEVIATGSANCIDGTLLFASLLELTGMEAVLIVRTGHAYVGVRSRACDGDADCIASTRVWPVETTMVGSASFIDAYLHGIQSRANDPSSYPLYREVGVEQARTHGVTPVPR